MKRLIGIFAVIMVASWMLTSCSNSICKKPGCNREAIGWKHTAVGCMREVPFGGYCSKNHCATHH